MFFTAAEFGYVKIIQTLLVQDFQCNRAAEDNYAIRYAATNGHLAVVKYQMEEVNEKYGIDPAAEDNQAVRYAAQEGHLDVVKYLIEEVDAIHGIDPAADENYAIQCAASNGHLDVVKYLMEEVEEKYGIEPAAEDNYAIRAAASYGYLAVVKYLMEEVDERYGIEPAALNNEAIRNAASSGHLDEEGEELRMWQFVSAFGQLAQSIDFSTDSEKQKQLQACDLDKMLNNELEWLQTSVLPTQENNHGQDLVMDNPLGLEKQAFKFVCQATLCHNDLLSGNILTGKDWTRVTIIDYEYGKINYRGFDLANYVSMECNYIKHDVTENVQICEYL